jgi:RNA polymerase sigma-70 factor (ECF subfamily)
VDATRATLDFRTWVEPHWDAMRRIAERLAAPGERDDVLQEALAAAWRRQSTFDPERGSLRNWLLAITANEARRSHRSPWHFQPLGDYGVDARTGNLDIARALGRLPRRQRLAVELFYFIGLGVSDVAQVMGCAEGTVKSTLSAARAHLRSVLGEDYV